MEENQPDKRKTSLPVVAVKKVIAYLSALFTPVCIDSFFLVIIYLSFANYINIKAVGSISCILAVNFCVMAVFDMGLSEAVAILVGRNLADQPKMNGLIHKTYVVVIAQILLACTFMASASFSYQVL